MHIQGLSSVDKNAVLETVLNKHHVAWHVELTSGEIQVKEYMIFVVVLYVNKNTTGKYVT